MATRRPKGEGSIYWDEERQQYRVKVRYRDELGRVRHRKPGFDTLQEAQAAKRELLKERDQGVTPSADTLKGFAEFWFEHVAPLTRSPKTIGNDRSQFKNHVEPLLGMVRLDRLNATQIQKWANAEALKHSRTALACYTLLRTILARAVKMRRLAFSPMEGTEPPRHTYAEPHVLTAAECKRLLKAAEGTLLEGPVRVALTLGLRHGEITGAKWADVDLVRGVWTVRGQWQEKTRRVKLPKGERVRSLRIPPALSAWLLARKAVANSVFVFPAETGGVFQDTRFQARWHEVRVKAKLPGLEFRYLRNTCASMMDAANVPIAVRIATLGHRDFDVTREHYTRMADDDAQFKALAEIEARLG